MARRNETGGWCHRCYAQVALRRGGTDHALHLLLSLAIAICWPLLWALPPQVRQGWRCGACGSRRVTANERAIVRLLHEKRHGGPDRAVTWG